MIIITYGEFIFWFWVFSILYSSCALMDIYFFWLVKSFPWSSWKYFQYLWPGFTLLSLFLLFTDIVLPLFQISHLFCVLVYLFIFFLEFILLTEAFIFFHLIINIWDSLSYGLYNLCEVYLVRHYNDLLVMGSMAQPASWWPTHRPGAVHPRLQGKSMSQTGTLQYQPDGHY